MHIYGENVKVEIKAILAHYGWQVMNYIEIAIIENLGWGQHFHIEIQSANKKVLWKYFLNNIY